MHVSSNLLMMGLLYAGAVESLPDIQSVLEALQKPVEGTGLTSPAWELLSEAFSSPEVLIASFGRVKDSSCPMCHAQQHEHSAQHSTVNGEKHSSSQVQSKVCSRETRILAAISWGLTILLINLRLYAFSLIL